MFLKMCLRGFLLSKVHHSAYASEKQYKLFRKCFPSILANNISSLNQSKVYDTLAPLGLSEEQSLLMVESHPEICSCNNGKLQYTVDALMKCQFGHKELAALVSKYPYLLCVDHSNIEYTFQKLMSIGTKSFAYKVLFNAPNVLNDCWSDVQNKLDYLENVMLFSKGEIAVSGSLNYSLNYIMMRHTFLMKVGVFKKLKPKVDHHERQKINPRLEVILNTSDSNFATNVAFVTLFEYEVYQQIFEPDECL